MALITNFKEQGIDLGAEYVDAFEMVPRYPEKFPGWYSDPILNPAGGLWAWGHNGYGLLGIGDITNRSSPVQVGSLTNWKATSARNYHTTAIKTDGTLWCWGYNDYGQLGLGDTTPRSSPVQVGSLTTWKSVSAGNYHTTAIK